MILNSRLVSFVFLGLAVVVPIGLRAQTPQQTLQQYVADLKNNPHDAALRQKIIALAQTMRPAPAIPPSAHQDYVMAVTFVESAKDNTGYEHAIDHFKSALLAAPWWMDAYKKLAIAQKAAGHYDDAIATLNLYLLAQPADASDAQDEIYKLMALKQAAADDVQRRANEERARENSPEAIAARKQAEYDAWLKGLDGARYSYQHPGGWTITIDIHGRYAQYGTINRSCEQCGPVGVYQPSTNGWSFRIQDREFTGRFGNVVCTATITDEVITEQCPTYARYYQRQREQ
jgi:tetratricopeptide (TPR) repeat protein